MTMAISGVTYVHIHPWTGDVASGLAASSTTTAAATAAATAGAGGGAGHPLLNLTPHGSRHRKFSGDWSKAVLGEEEGQGGGDKGEDKGEKGERGLESLQALPPPSPTHPASTPAHTHTHTRAASTPAALAAPPAPEQDLSGCRTTIGEEERGVHIVQPPAGLMTLVCCQVSKVRRRRFKHITHTRSVV